jgi:hypothetical protein
MERFIIQPSQEQENWWVLTDTENQIVVRFENKRFNQTQQVTMLEDVETPNPLVIARMMREIGDYLAINHRDKV